MKFNIMVAEEVVDDKILRSEFLKKLEDLGVSLNKKSMDRFEGTSILTVEMSSCLHEKVKDLPEVESIRLNKSRRATKETKNE